MPKSPSPMKRRSSSGSAANQRRVSAQIRKARPARGSTSSSPASRAPSNRGLGRARTVTSSSPGKVHIATAKKPTKYGPAKKSTGASAANKKRTAAQMAKARKK